MGKRSANDITDAWIPALTPEESAVLVSYGGEVKVSNNEVLIRQGERQDTLFLLLAGELSAQASSHRSKVELGKIQPGESVGEMSILDPFEASATIRALRNGKLWRIERAAFERYLDEHPVAGTKVLRHIAVTMARRARRASDHIIHQADAAYYDWD